MAGRGGIYNGLHGDGTPVGRPNGESIHIHSWSAWKTIGNTGDWFHPHIVERKCATCPATETDEH